MTKVAIVTALEGNHIKLRFWGEEEESEKWYLGTCAPAVGDKVICLLVEGTYIVIGVVQ